jgi:hypothetical protein
MRRAGSASQYRFWRPTRHDCDRRKRCILRCLRRSRLFGQLPGRNKLKAGSRLLVSPFPRNQICPVLWRGAVKLVGSRRPVGKVGETHCVFPGLSIGDRACAVRRGSAQPTVHKFTAPARHGVRRPVPSQPLIGRGKPRPVFASCN